MNLAVRNGLDVTRLVLTVLAAVLAAGCAPVLDAAIGGDLGVVGPDVAVVGERTTYVLLGSAAPGLGPVEWSVNGRVVAGTSPTLDVVFERPGDVVVAAQAHGPTGVRVQFRQVTVRLPERAPGTPDVVVFAFSGRHDPISPATDNRDDWAYWHAVSLQTAVAAVDPRARAELLTYRSSVFDDPLRGRGFLSALADLDEVVETLIVGVSNPTKIVVMGHSHGTQFAHLLARERPTVVFAASVLLDSICLKWDLDHAHSYLMAVRNVPASSLGLIAPLFGCKSVPVLGRHLDEGDVVPRNVEVSLEIWSNGWHLGVGRDVTPNVRVDGSYRGIEPHLFVGNESHGRVSEWFSESYRRAVDWIAAVTTGAAHNLAPSW